MTEEEWLRCQDPLEMFEVLRASASRRKLRLYLCARAYRFRHLLPDPRSWYAVETAERFADGLAAFAEAGDAHTDACRAAHEFTGVPSATDYRPELSYAAWLAAHAVYLEVQDHGASQRVGSLVPPWLLCHLLRDIFGSPFRRITAGPSWLTPAVRGLATEIYEERGVKRGNLDPVRLAILADALEDAGCTSDDILGHCRGDGPHVRGCWAVDLVLGKN